MSEQSEAKIQATAPDDLTLEVSIKLNAGEWTEEYEDYGEHGTRAFRVPPPSLRSAIIEQAAHEVANRILSDQTATGKLGEKAWELVQAGLEEKVTPRVKAVLDEGVGAQYGPKKSVEELAVAWLQGKRDSYDRTTHLGAIVKAIVEKELEKEVGTFADLLTKAKKDLKKAFEDRIAKAMLDAAGARL